MKTIRQEKAQAELTNPKTVQSKEKVTKATNKIVKSPAKKSPSKPRTKQSEENKNITATQPLGEGVVVMPPSADRLKKRRIRKNYTFDPDFVSALEAYCEDHKISSSQLIEYTVSQLIGFKN